MVALAALGILVAFYAFLKLTRVGLAMQAVSQDRETAGLMGIESGTIYVSAFGLACLLAGALMAPIYTVGPYMGEPVVLKAFVIVILGGLGSIPGAVLGGLVIGLSESVLATYLDATTALAASFGLVLLIVGFKPTRLMGRRV